MNLFEINNWNITLKILGNIVYILINYLNFYKLNFILIDFEINLYLIIYFIFNNFFDKIN